MSQVLVSDDVPISVNDASTRPTDKRALRLANISLETPSFEGAVVTNGITSRVYLELERVDVVPGMATSKSRDVSGCMLVIAWTAERSWW
jgi:hypothetical protein